MSVSPIVIKPSSIHTATLVFLHGLGDTGHGWASTLRSMVPPHCKLVCPHAPTIPLTVYGGEKLPAWFDVLARSPGSAVQDPVSVLHARTRLEQLLTEEASALSSVGGARRCLLGGFSMGGALALYTGLTGKFVGQLGGLIGLSCYLPLGEQPDQLEAQLTWRGQHPPPTPPPVFMAHGDCDEVVRPQMGAAAREIMQSRLGVSDLRFRSYAGLDHSAGDQEIADLKEFISTMLSEASPGRLNST